MEIFNSLGVLPLLAVLGAAIYSMLAVGLASLKLINGEINLTFDKAELFSKTQIKKRSLVAFGLASFALLSEIVLVVTKTLPEGVFIFIFLALFPSLILCAIASVILSNIALTQNPQSLDFISILIGTISLVLVSAWLFAPIFFLSSSSLKKELLS